MVVCQAFLSSATFSSSSKNFIPTNLASLNSVLFSFTWQTCFSSSCCVPLDSLFWDSLTISSHHLFLITRETGCCLLVYLISALLNSFHLMLSIFLRHLFSKESNFFSISLVVFQLSHAKMRVDITFELNSLSLVFVLINFECHMF